jgi:hypothetical protein
MLATLRVPALLVAGTIALAGCANLEGFGGGSEVTTSSVAPTPKIDPACVALTSQIDGLRKDGIADKLEKAAAKKYKLTAADITKADQLNKANAEFQNKCSTLAPRSAGYQPSAPAAAQASVAQPPAKAAAVAAR